MPKKYTLTEEQFVMLNSYALHYLNRTIQDLKDSKSVEVSKYYQKEIDQCADVLESIHRKYDTYEVTSNYHHNKINNQ